MLRPSNEWEWNINKSNIIPCSIDLVVATYVGSMCGDIPALQGLASCVFMGSRESDLPPELRELRQEMQATAAAAYARRIYQQHRPVSSNGRIAQFPARKGANPLRKHFWSLAAVVVAVVGAGFAWSTRA